MYPRPDRIGLDEDVAVIDDSSSRSHISNRPNSTDVKRNGPNDHQDSAFQRLQLQRRLRCEQRWTMIPIPMPTTQR